MNDKDTTLLSSILTAVTGVAKTLIAVRDDQKIQTKRLDDLEELVNKVQNDLETVTTRQIAIESTLANSLDSIEKESKDAHDRLFTVMRETFDDKLNRLIDVISSDETADEVSTSLDEFRQSFFETMSKNQDTIEIKLDSMNQLKLMKTLIETLSTMQTDVTTLTNSIVKNSDSFEQLSTASSLMAARLDAVDLRFASFVDDKSESKDTDDGLKALDDVVKLLESQQ
jgi:hypothetical protein